MLSSVLLAISLALGVCATPHHQNHHQGIAKRRSADVQLHKRFSDARWSFYDVGLGACGQYNGPADYIVALNANQFGSGYPGPHCFETITMNYNGKTAQATIMDRCPGCPYGGLDLSRGLFTHFASEGTGIIYGTWTFNDGSGGGAILPSPSPSPSPKPTTSWSSTTTKAKPTPTPTPEPTTSSSSKTSSSTSTSHSTTTTTTSSTSSTTTSSSTTTVDYTSDGLAVPTGTLPSTPGSVQNLNSINLLLIQYGGLIVAASSLQ